MPKKVSGTPNRQPRKPKRRVPARTVSAASAPAQHSAIAPQPPAERTRAESPARSFGGRVRAQAAPVVDFHYVTDDLKRVGLIAVAMFAALGILAVLLR